MNFATRVITISTSQGEKLVDAYIHGKFAVHLPIGQEIDEDSADALWVITHIVSGMSVLTRRERSRARELAREFDAAIATDITKADVESKNEAAKSFVAALKTLVIREKRDHR